jgi:hypothetical protein
MTAKEIKILVDRVLGAVSVFPQGGTLRLILPKSAAKMLGNYSRDSSLNDGEEEKPTFILIATNKGIILRSLKDYLEDEEMKLSNGK